MVMCQIIRMSSWKTVRFVMQLSSNHPTFRCSNLLSSTPHVSKFSCFVRCFRIKTNWRSRTASESVVTHQSQNGPDNRVTGTAAVVFSVFSLARRRICRFYAVLMVWITNIVWLSRCRGCANGLKVSSIKQP